MTHPEAVTILNTVYSKIQHGQNDFAANLIIDVYDQGFKAGQEEEQGKLKEPKEDYCPPRHMFFLFLCILGCSIGCSFGYYAIGRYEGWWVTPARIWMAIVMWTAGLVAFLAFAVYCQMIAEENKAKRKREAK